MEVINTRVCSKASPAPGNQGFDGCLEFLASMCRAHARALTVWDEEKFHFIDASGSCSSLDKRSVLHESLPKLRYLMKNMRHFTICSGGEIPPRQVLRSVSFVTAWAAKQVRSRSELGLWDNRFVEIENNLPWENDHGNHVVSAHPYPSSCSRCGGISSLVHPLLHAPIREPRTSQVSGPWTSSCPPASTPSSYRVTPLLGRPCQG